MKSIKILIACSLMMAGISCSKSFSDLAPYNALPLPVATSSEANLYTAVNGMYASLRSTSLFGRLLPLKGDLMGDNTWVKLANSGRFLDYNDYNITLTNTNAQALWAAAYVSIKHANLIINSTLAKNTNVDQLRGEAYAVRALVYFHLLLNFSKPFTIDAAGLGVPIVTSFDQSILPTRNTSAEVYKLITDDLAQAYTLMTFTPGQNLNITGTNIVRAMNTSYMTRYSARALQAKVYLHMGDYVNAKAAALDVVTAPATTGFTLLGNAGYVAYWKSPLPLTSRVETIFEVTNDISNNNGTDAMAYLYDQGGYGDILATTDLVSKYRPTDVRLGVINTGTANAATIYVVNKYSNTSNTTDKDDIKILRFSDILLILAEASARTGDEATARTRVNQLAQNREPTFTGYLSTGAQLIDDIVLERRKELAFEGDRLFDLNRLNLPVNKFRRENPITKIDVAAGDFRRIFPIPTTETDVNPNIKAQQNAGY